MRHLDFPIAATRAGMVAERAVRAFWPLWTVVFLVLAPVLFGWLDLLSINAFWAYVTGSAFAIVAALVWGARRFVWPSRAAAMARVDAAMPGRPIAALADQQAIGAGDPASEAVWQAHLARMAERTKSATAVDPDLRISDRDSYGLRYMALLFFVSAALFGSALRIGAGDPAGGASGSVATGPVWEGWVEPPDYTGKPSLYLNDIPAGPLRIAEGSTVTLRLYGDAGALSVSETISGRTQDLGAASDAQQSFVVAQSGQLTIDGGTPVVWDVTVIADQPPLVELTGPIESDAQGELRQPFLAIDDYGVVSGTATIALDLASVTRAHGLVADPDPLEPLVLDLPMPFTGDRTDFEDFLVENLSQHPLANLPVTLTLQVVDGAGQLFETAPEPIVLPGRRFFQPFAKAVIEQRRDLMWTRENDRRVTRILRAMSYRPEGLFSNETTYLRIRAIIRRLDSFKEFGLTPDVQEELVLALWDLAIQLEDGTLADARKRLERAQERLAEAMRNGASDEEIAELMQELREATDDYMQMLADQMDPEENGTDQANNGESREIGQDEIQALMDRIQELMEEGRMAEAEALMEQLNQLLENLRMTAGDGSGDGPRTPGQQSMEDLADTLRDQEDLSDEAFRDLQERFNGQQQGQQDGQQGEQGQQGQQGQQDGQQGNQPRDGQSGQQGEGQGVGNDSQGGQSGGDDAGEEGNGGGSLADRQQALREELNRQQQGLPNLEGEAGDIAREALRRAEDAMDGAEDALRSGNLAEAIDQQAEAMDALRNGMRSLGQALARDENAQPGEGSEQGFATGRVEPSRRDPLGRELGNTGQFGTDENMLNGESGQRRAEELLDEIRRRSAEQDRPVIELDYLKRLLERF